MNYAPKWPLKKGTTDIFEMYEDIKDLINYHLKSLLLTSPGEKISDSSYGVGLRRFIFEQYNIGAINDLRSTIASQISFYIPSINVQSIKISEDPDMIDAGVLSIYIEYSIPGYINRQTFELNLNNEQTIGFY